MTLLTRSETHSQSTGVEIGSTGLDIEATIGVESGKTSSTCMGHSEHSFGSAQVKATTEP